jgi:DNA invertase Pin-like site-specific DNA recombinase
MTKRQRITLLQQRADQVRVIAYYRVSTVKQGESGLGLEAQEAAVAAYVASTASTLVAAYREVESGRHNDRPQLATAIAHAKRAKAILVIAKLDRLARNVAFVATLMESKVKFVCCDNPHANPLTVHILAAVAEDEAKRISERTKAGLAALKARGLYSNRLGRTVTLGAPEHLTSEARLKGAIRGRAERQARKVEAYEHLQPLIRELRAEGLGFHAIAKRLTELGETTRNGLPWNPVQVRRVLLMQSSPADPPPPFRAAV